MDTREERASNPIAVIGHSSGQVERLSDDLIFGAEAIGAEIGKTSSQVYYIAQKKKLPIGRLGKQLIASRTRLRRAVAALTA